MRLLWTVVRVIAILLAIPVTLVTVLWVESPTGRTIAFDGLVIDLIALAVIIAAGLSLWRDRRRLV